MVAGTAGSQGVGSGNHISLKDFNKDFAKQGETVGDLKKDFKNLDEKDQQSVIQALNNLGLQQLATALQNKNEDPSSDATQVSSIKPSRPAQQAAPAGQVGQAGQTGASDDQSSEMMQIAMLLAQAQGGKVA